jgi:hypothetical protein
MTIVAAGSVNDFFLDAVEDAIKSRRVEATPAATSYIVSLLADFAKPGALAEQTLERPLTFLLDEALHTADTGARFDKLRALGDGILYSSGFFADHFEARGVDQGYIIGLGATAYESAGAIIAAPGALARRDSSQAELDIFAELAQKFAAFVAVIADVADATIAQGIQSSRAIVKLYERWLRTRSDRLADALRSQGFVAPRGNNGSGSGTLS